MTESIWLWVGFNAFVLAMLALDLGVFHRQAHVVSLKESFAWTGTWIALALVFNAGIWHYYGSQKGLEFFTGYLIYDMMHYYLHHFRPHGRLGRMLRERHMRHHFQDDTRGFGISAPYWDEVFRTSSRAKRSSQ